MTANCTQVIYSCRKNNPLNGQSLSLSLSPLRKYDSTLHLSFHGKRLVLCIFEAHHPFKHLLFNNRPLLVGIEGVPSHDAGPLPIVHAKSLKKNQVKVRFVSSQELDSDIEKNCKVFNKQANSNKRTISIETQHI